MALAAGAEDTAIPYRRRRALTTLLHAAACIGTRLINNIRKVKHVAKHLLVLLLILPLFPVTVAFAADEDTAASVYLVFDPDTGEFITVDDPNRSQMHAEQEEAIMSGVTTGDAAGGAATEASVDGVNTLRSSLIIAVLAAVLIGGFVALRRRRPSPATGPDQPGT